MSYGRLGGGVRGVGASGAKRNKINSFGGKYIIPPIDFGTQRGFFGILNNDTVYEMLYTRFLLGLHCNFFSKTVYVCIQGEQILLFFF